MSLERLGNYPSIKIESSLIYWETVYLTLSQSLQQMAGGNLSCEKHSCVYTVNRITSPLCFTMSDFRIFFTIRCICKFSNLCVFSLNPEFYWVL